MKKVLLFIFIFFIVANSSFAFNKKLQNNLSKTDFINKGYLSYDLKSFKYNPTNDTYIIDVMEELDPGGDMENIKCPYEEGYITHIIFSTKYSPKKKYFKFKYKGFICATGEYKYENSKPIVFYYNYTGIFYNNNPHIIPSLDLGYLNNLKKEINNPDEYNYFGIIQNIKKDF